MVLLYNARPDRAIMGGREIAFIVFNVFDTEAIGDDAVNREIFRIPIPSEFNAGNFTISKTYYLNETFYMQFSDGRASGFIAVSNNGVYLPNERFDLGGPTTYHDGAFYRYDGTLNVHRIFPATNAQREAQILNLSNTISQFNTNRIAFGDDYVLMQFSTGIGFQLELYDYEGNTVDVHNIFNATRLDSLDGNKAYHQGRPNEHDFGEAIFLYDFSSGTIQRINNGDLTPISISSAWIAERRLSPRIIPADAISITETTLVAKTHLPVDSLSISEEPVTETNSTHEPFDTIRLNDEAIRERHLNLVGQRNLAYTTTAHNSIRVYDFPQLTRRSDLDFDVLPSAIAISFRGDILYIPGHEQASIFAYRLDGTRVPENDIPIPTVVAHGRPTSSTINDDIIYLASSWFIDAYNLTTKQYVADLSFELFDLRGMVGNFSGIKYYNNLFYITGGPNSLRVTAINPDGTENTESSFTPVIEIPEDARSNNAQIQGLNIIDGVFYFTTRYFASSGIVTEIIRYNPTTNEIIDRTRINFETHDLVVPQINNPLLDSISITDEIESDIIGVVSESEQVSVTDTLKKNNVSRIIDEDVGINENIQINVGELVVSLLDNISISDGIDIDQVRQILETVGISESFSTEEELVQTITDVIDLIETVRFATELGGIDISDSISVSDAVTLSTVAGFIQNAIDTFDLDDAVEKSRQFVRGETDAVFQTDTANRETTKNRNISDSVGVGETVQFMALRISTLFDTVRLSDTIITNVFRIRNLAEGFSISDTIRKDISRLATSAISTVDNAIKGGVNRFRQSIDVVNFVEKVRTRLRRNKPAETVELDLDLRMREDGIGGYESSFGYRMR